MLEEQTDKTYLNSIPNHVAIIMDGNRRWAKQKDMPSAFGHWKGAEVLTDIVKAASNLGVKVLTVYAFSTENWLRNPSEVEYLMQLFENYLIQQKDSMIQEGVKLDAIGDLSKLPERLQKVFHDVKHATSSGNKIELVLALSYGGRDDILRGIKSIIDDCEAGKLSKDEITEMVFSKYLDTKKWHDPDLLIRTSGEKRLSNFLLWQLCYTEVVISDELWPDFSSECLENAISEYRQRKRRKGFL
jgi:undecaprenyl diphosphate synthase